MYLLDLQLILAFTTKWPDGKNVKQYVLLENTFLPKCSKI